MAQREGAGDPLRRALDGLAGGRWGGFVDGLRLAVLVADGTRSWSHRRVFPAVLERVRRARALEVFVCTGTHSGTAPETRALLADLRAAAGAAFAATGTPDVRFWVHEARAPDLVRLGTTPHGTPVDVHPRLGGCDRFLVVADMKNHYFAGYSNPVKYYLPGLASFEAARRNHELALDPRARVGMHPWHPDPKRRDNPLAADMVAAMGCIVGEREHLALALTTEGERVTWACLDETRAASAAGMREVDSAFGLALPPARFAIVSAGGAPFDESLYTAQRALELSRAAVRAGGELLLLARCPNGIGPREARANFFEPLQRPLAELLVPPRPYRMYGHKPFRLARTIADLERVWLLSDLPAADVASIHLEPAASIQDVVDGWMAKARGADRVHVIDEGSKLSIVATKPGSGFAERRPQVPMP